MNQLYDSLQNHETREVLFEIFEALDDYTKTHFKFEEDNFKKLNYEKQEEHIKLHRFFENKVKSLELKIKNESQDIEDLLQFLVDWFMQHIRKIDQEYVPLFKENHVK
jgi:hemerythrin-like metal-binding protein